MDRQDPEEGSGLGALLRRRRLAAELTQESLAERAGLGTRSIQSLERGVQRPRRETLARLVEALDLTAEERVAFEAAARPAPRRRRNGPAAPSAAAVPPEAAPAPRHNLPTPLTSFVGREREIAEVRRLLATTRLLTLTGTGGCGKTRLGLRVVDGLVAGYPDGVWLVELASLADPALVPQTIAAALGVRAESSQPVLDVVLPFLRPRQLLLVLDNCEHLVQACAEVADTLLRACPGLRILATGREALGVPGEVGWRVPSLAAPPPDRLPPLRRLRRWEAVRLFLDRAAAAEPAFALTQANARAVAQICWRLDGIPLALELAAVRVTVLTAEHIADRLDDRFRLLTGGSRTAPPRHQTLRATLDWSHELLSDPERRLLRRLAVFAGGWSLEAAETVCAGAGVEEPAVLDLLTRLVDKSLVQVEQREGEERYRLLETLRQYGRERLVEAGEEEGVRDRHRDWFLRFAERAKPELVGPRQVFWLDRLESEHANLRAALEWAVERGPAELGLRLAGALWRFFFARDYLAEGQEWLARALAAPGALAPTAARADVLDGACELASGHDAGLALRLAGESLAIHRLLGDRPGAAWALRLLAQCAVNKGDEARAEELGVEALALARETGASWVVAQVLETLGGAAHKRGAYPLARRRMEESLALFRALDDRRAIAWSLQTLGWQTCQRGEYAAARAYLQEAVAVGRELRSASRTGDSLSVLGVVARLEGDYGRSRALLEEGFALVRKSGDRWQTGVALFNIGSLARAEGDVGRAETLLKEGLAVFRDLGAVADAAATVVACGVVAIQRGAHRRGARLLGAVKPHSLRRSWLFRDDPRVYEESLAAARAALGERDFAAATAQGEAMTLEQAIADALDDGSEDRPVVPAGTTGDAD